jgi:Tetratricopeptide repeat
VLAERLGEPPILAHALNNLGTAQFQTGSPDGKAKLERSLAVARAASSEEHVARALGNLASTALDVRSYATAKRYIEEAIEYTRERDLGPKLDYVVALRARCDLEQGRWRAAAKATTTSTVAPPPTRSTSPRRRSGCG